MVMELAVERMIIMATLALHLSWSASKTKQKNRKYTEHKFILWFVLFSCHI